MNKTIVTITAAITIAAVFFTTFNLLTTGNTDNVKNTKSSKINMAENLKTNNESYKQEIREGEMSVLSSILEKKSDFNAARISWDWLIENGFNSKESIEHLLELRKNGGGWIYYSELTNIFFQKPQMMRQPH